MDIKLASDIAFTPAVKEAQRQRGSRRAYEKTEQRGSWSEEVNEMLADFVAQRDSVYLGTASADGRPYIQHRGGPKGFVKVLDRRTLAFADYSGNRQYISVGNLSENDKAFLFLMDYPSRTRVKIWGRARFVENDPGLLAKLIDPDYKARPERALVFHIEAWDVNCRQHIQERHTLEEMETVIEPLRRRIAELEDEKAALKAQQPTVGASASKDLPHCNAIQGRIPGGASGACGVENRSSKRLKGSWEGRTLAVRGSTSKGASGSGRSARDARQLFSG